MPWEVVDENGDRCIKWEGSVSIEGFTVRKDEPIPEATFIQIDEAYKPYRDDLYPDPYDRATAMAREQMRLSGWDKFMDLEPSKPKPKLKLPVPKKPKPPSPTTRFENLDFDS